MHRQLRKILIAALLVVACRTPDFGKKLDESECPAGTTWTEVTSADGELAKKYQRTPVEEDETPKRSTGYIAGYMPPRNVLPEDAQTFTFCLDDVGIRQGAQFMTRTDGRIFRSTFRDGISHGLHQSWNENGELVGKSHYKDGERIGRYHIGDATETGRRSAPEDPVHPCPDGAIVAGASPPEGRVQWCERDIGRGVFVKHGAEIKWERNGDPDERSEYRDGFLHGEKVTWKDGVKQYTYSYSGGKLEGSQWHWRENGSPIRESVYENEVPIRHTYWSPTGVKVSEKTRDASGELVFQREWYESDHPKRFVRWKDGKRVEDRGWYPDGTKKREIIGIPNSYGSERHWYENGQPKSEEHWENGWRAGTSREWTELGELAMEIVYEGRSRQVSRTVFPVHEPKLPNWAPEARPRGARARPSLPLECPGGRIARVRVRDPGESRDPLLLRPDHDLMDPTLGYQIAWYVAEVVLKPPLWIEATREAHCGSDVLDGPAAMFEPQQEPVFTGQYLNGKKDGTWSYWGVGGSKQGEVVFEGDEVHRITLWTPAGRIHSVQNFRNGVRHGPYSRWHRDSSARYELAVFREGEKHGPYLRYREDGRLKFTGEKRQGKSHGLSVSWGPRGGREEATWRAGEMEGPYAKYDREGNLVAQGRYKDAKKHGVWVEMQRGVKRAETTFADGKRHGVYRRYGRDGNLSATGRWEGGRYHGNYRRYDRHGNLAESGQYVSGRKDGTWTTFYDDGSKSRIGSYSAGAISGTWVYLNKNGTHSAEGAYTPCKQEYPKEEFIGFEGERYTREFPRDGCRTGAWTFWNEEGVLRVDKQFE